MTAVRVPRQREDALSTLVIGAGEAGRALARDLRQVVSFGLRPIGFLDDDAALADATVAGMPVLGGIGDLERVVAEHDVSAVVIAIPSMDPRRIHAVGVRAAALGVTVRHLPPFLAVLQGEAAGTDMRALPVGTLIGRAERHVVRSAVSSVITGKRVLVTGAGGSIGSELCRQVSAFGPAELVLLDHDESNLHRLQLELWGQADLDDESVVVADIRDGERIHQIFRDKQPQVVFHAAALKHLPVLEIHPCEGVKSNVLGTENLVRAAIAHDVERFVLISTDKAANPTSVLGATKRLAELVLQTYEGSSCALASVRFGNVLGSRGSLLHVLKQQLVNGREVTITHPEVSRFFMTIEEAAGLVLEAARMAEESGTYVLDMGEPVRIVDLVDNFASLLNVGDVTIRYTGLRPGEKLHEELFDDAESRQGTDHPRITRAEAEAPGRGFLAGLHDLYDAATHNRPAEVYEHLSRLLPDYEPARRERSRPQLALASPYPDGF